uniref:Uncharacterized protein n=1 Tax=Syphacia muris TaxID=451379 RepID=A0A0N5AN24_9BILA
MSNNIEVKTKEKEKININVNVINMSTKKDFQSLRCVEAEGGRRRKARATAAAAAAAAAAEAALQVFLQGRQKRRGTAFPTTPLISYAIRISF